MDAKQPETPDVNPRPQASSKDKPVKNGAKPATRRWPIRSAALNGLLILACFYTLVFAKAVLMPLTLALIIAFLFSPIVERLERYHLPKPLGAGLVVLTLLATLVCGVYFLADPAKKWMEEGPNVISQLQSKLKKTVADIEEARQQVEQMMNGQEDPAKASQRLAKKDQSLPVKREPLSLSIIDIVASTSAVVAQFGGIIIIVTALSYMILISEDIFKLRLIKVMSRMSERKRALHILEGVKREVASYLATVTVINACVGICVGIAMYAAGLPNAVLWGTLAAFLNYLPFIGPIIGIAIIGLVGLLTYPEPIQAWLPLALYLGIHGIESQFVTPAVLGRRMTLNPAFVFISIVVWGWLWGVVGALIAVPMLAITKVFCDHIESLSSLGELLSGPEQSRPRSKTSNGENGN